MAGRQRAEAEIRDLNKTLEGRVERRNEQLLAAERDISERHRLEEQLRQRTEELALEGPAQGRVPRHARARVEESARADTHNGRGAQARSVGCDGEVKRLLPLARKD